MKFNYLLVAVMTFSAHQVIAGGPISGCLQTHTVVPGESCDAIAANFKLTADEFYNMNPGLHHAGDHLCDNLDDGKKYCVCIEKPCVAEPSSANGNSTASASGSGTSSPGINAAHVDVPSSNANPAPAAVAGSPSPSPSPSSTSPKSPPTVARSVSSTGPATGAAVSGKIVGASVPVSVVALSLLAITSL